MVAPQPHLHDAPATTAPSALATGERRPKSDLRFEAIGTIDELNAHVGLARLEKASLPDGLDAMLGRIQNDLFDLGADLATPDKPGRERLRIVATQVARLESGDRHAQRRSRAAHLLRAARRHAAPPPRCISAAPSRAGPSG